jgi:hypothetical protein
MNEIGYLQGPTVIGEDNQAVISLLHGPDLNYQTRSKHIRIRYLAETLPWSIRLPHYSKLILSPSLPSELCSYEEFTGLWVLPHRYVCAWIASGS